VSAVAPVVVRRVRPARLAASSAVILLDERGRVEALSPAAARMAGAGVRSIVGRLAGEALPVFRTAGGRALSLGAPGLRAAAAGWPARPEPVVVAGPGGLSQPRTLELVTLDWDGRRRVLATLVGPSEAPPVAGPRASALTERQLAVLRELANGQRCSQIAIAFGIADATVRHHIHAILAALGARSQLAAVAEARRRGLV